MTPAERLQAAIDRLKELRARGSSGGDPWDRSGTRIVFREPTGKFAIAEQGNWGTPADLDMIVTLHATIDAQIGILGFAILRLNAVQRLTGKHLEAHQYEMALVDAILGEA